MRFASKNCVKFSSLLHASSVQAVIAPSACLLKPRTPATALTEHEIASLAYHVLKVGLVKERAVHIVDVLGKQMDTDALPAHIGKNLQYLLLVHFLGVISRE